MSVADQIEALRQKRRQQLDQILASGSGSSQSALNFQPVPLPQSQGSNILGYFLGPLSGTAPVGNVPAATPAPVQASNQTFSLPAAKTSPAAASPGGKPLSPPPKKPDLMQQFQQMLQNSRAGQAASHLGNKEFLKAIQALFL